MQMFDDPSAAIDRVRKRAKVVKFPAAPPATEVDNTDELLFLYSKVS